jgi:hypothetical protein
MKPRVKYGLIVGVAGMLLNVCVSAALGVCGPMMSLLAGAIAGFLTGQAEQAPERGDGARLGAISGLIAGGLMLVGQLFGGAGILAFVQFAEIPIGFGTVPQTSDLVGTASYWGIGLGVAGCFGLVGLVLSALAGAAGGYLGTPSRKTKAGSN